MCFHFPPHIAQATLRPCLDNMIFVDPPSLVRWMGENRITTAFITAQLANALLLVEVTLRCSHFEFALVHVCWSHALIYFHLPLFIITPININMRAQDQITTMGTCQKGCEIRVKHTVICACAWLQDTEPDCKLQLQSIYTGGGKLLR